MHGIFGSIPSKIILSFVRHASSKAHKKGLPQRLKYRNGKANLAVKPAASCAFPRSDKLQPKARLSSIEEELLPLVAIVGKPNVGKSALFNRFLQRKQALVKNTPEDHVTRDYREERGRIGDLWFKAIDTSGLEPDGDERSIQARTTGITLSVLQKADLALLLLDAKDGITSRDELLAKWLKKSVSSPILLIANKAESGRSRGSEVADMLAEGMRLGLGEAVPISAESGEGMIDLYNGMQPYLDKCRDRREELHKLREKDMEADAQLNRISIAVVGVPNAGKSTLMNQLVGHERSLTGPEPGLTRDSVSETLAFRGYQIDLIDTAGWLDRSRLKYGPFKGVLAEEAQVQTQRSYNRAHIILLLIDALTIDQGERGLLKRELALVGDIAKEGRAIVVLLNKLDAIDPRKRLEVEAKLERSLQQTLPDVRGAAWLSISALTGEGVHQVLPVVVRSFKTWNQQIKTNELNKWLVKIADTYGTEAAKHVLRVRFVTQVSTRPPTFVAYVSGSSPYAENSLKFLGNALRQEFGYDGVPLRIHVRMRQKLDGIDSTRPKKRQRKQSVHGSSMSLKEVLTA